MQAFHKLTCLSSRLPNAGAENMKWLNTFMKIAELQSASKPLSPEQARVRAMKQQIDRQKVALAQGGCPNFCVNGVKGH